jgi:hypothetical protein
MVKTPFYTVRQPGLSRLNVQDGLTWRAFCYHDIRAYTLDVDLLVLHHAECVFALRGLTFASSIFRSRLKRCMRSRFMPLKFHQMSAQ